MLRRASWIVLTSALALGACASTEGLSDSAVNTNLEFEQVQNRTLLLNVVRASLRRPPVYQTLTQLNASVRPSGDVSLSVPFGVNVSNANSFGLAVKGNEGPKLTSAPLDTQEFYQGIMAPIKMPTIDFYVQQGYPKALLYNLFFGRVELRRKGDTGGITITNYPTNDKDVDRFQVLINHLIWLGFTTEPVTGTSLAYGPMRTRGEVKDLAATAGAATAGLSVSEVTDEVCTKMKKGKCTQKVKRSRFRVAKPIATPGARLCFKPDASDSANATPRTCGKEQGAKVSLTWKHLSPVFGENAGLCAESLAAKACTSLRSESTALAGALCGKGGCKPADEIELSFVVRSTDGIIYYLGEVARRQHYPDGDPERVLGYRRAPSAQSTPCMLGKDNQWTDTNCQAIFWVDRDAASPGEVAAVEYEGTRFSVPGRLPGPTRVVHPGLRSSQVFGIVGQLLALNKAAKDQPNTSILNVINP